MKKHIGKWRLFFSIIAFSAFMLASSLASADLRYQRFSTGDVSTLGEIQFDNLSVTDSGSVSDIGFDLDNENYFALRFSGEFYAEADDLYYFSLQSDDGSALYIRNDLLVDNDGRHAAGDPVTNSIYLTQGYHPLKIEYFERAGGEVLSLRYQRQVTIDAGNTDTLSLSSVTSLGNDYDNDGYSDYYDKLYSTTCDISNSRLYNYHYTDYRDCDFTNAVADYSDDLRDKNFDSALFSNTNLGSPHFRDSSFRNSTFEYQYDSGNYYFWNVDFTNAQLEKHWSNAFFSNVDFSHVSFFTQDPGGPAENSEFCFINSTFSEFDLVQYDYDTGSTPYRLFGIPGYGPLPVEDTQQEFCFSGDIVDISQTENLVNNHSINIAPRWFMYQLLNINFTSNFSTSEIDDFETQVTTNSGNSNSRNYPVFGDNTRPAFRSADAVDSPYWEWEMGEYYHIKSLRLFQNVNEKDELEDAEVLVSDWPFGDEVDYSRNFDSIGRYALGKTATGYYDIPVNRSARYIRIFRPKGSDPKRLSFQKLEILGDMAKGIYPLSGAKTPQPEGYVLPDHEPGRSECSGFNSDLINPDFDIVSAQLNADENGAVNYEWADLSRMLWGDIDFEFDYFTGANFEQANLVGASFKGAKADSVNFRGANLQNADFSGSDISFSDFRGANLTGANFDNVRGSCSYFTGQIPDSFQDSHDNLQFPQISNVITDAAYGYARASSIDEATSPQMAVDDNINTSSVTALQKNAWWELDMGAVYTLQDIELFTGMTINQDQLLSVYVSDWPIAYDAKINDLPEYVRLITDFNLDQESISFHTNQTARFIRILVPASLGELKLRLKEVVAESSVVPSSPTTPMPLNAEQQNTVQNTQLLLSEIDRLIALYDQGEGDTEGVRLSVINLESLTNQAIDDSYNVPNITSNIRKILRPISGTKQILSLTQAAMPSIREPVKNIRNVLGIMEKAGLGVTVATKSIEAWYAEERFNLRHTMKKLVSLHRQIDRQISILRMGRSYITTTQSCAIYGKESDSVRTALEAYSAEALVKIGNTISQITEEKVMMTATESRSDVINTLLERYNTESTLQSLEDSGQILAEMGPFAAATTPIQIIMSQGEIYDGLTVFDILEWGADLIESIGDAVFSWPVIGDALTFVTNLLTSLIDDLIEAMTNLLGGGASSKAIAMNAISDIFDSLYGVAYQPAQLAHFYPDTEQYIVPALNSDFYNALFSLNTNPAFDSCANSLNLPSQWPDAELDSDGDGISNGLEIISGTLVDNPDSDLDGLSDYFETHWNLFAPDEASKFQANYALDGETERDTDDDGLPALGEFLNGTNPFIADTDGDGLNDRLEVLYKTNPLSEENDLSDWDLDLDGDGYTIAEEQALGLDPLDPNDVYQDHDGDGLNTDDELKLGFHHDLAAPSQVIDNIIHLQQPETQAKGIQPWIIEIDIRDFYTYGAADAELDATKLFIQEGNIAQSVTDPNKLIITLDRADQSGREVTVTFKVMSDGGDKMINVIFDIQAVDTPPEDDPGEETPSEDESPNKSGGIFSIWTILALVLMLAYRRKRLSNV